MKFIIRNNGPIANKYLRFAKWKIRKLSRKFGDVLYAEIYVKKASQRSQVYAVTVKMGVPGPDIIISAKSSNLKELWADLSSKMNRQLRKYSNRKSYS